jgi:nucleoside-diphosphate-sugar epimerase
MILNGSGVRIGVSGATGLIGRALSKALYQEGFEVIKFSRRVSLDYYGIRDTKQLSLCNKFVHLGEPANIRIYNSFYNGPPVILTDNLKNLIEVFGSNLIYASSGAVYGTSSRGLHPVHDPTYGLDPYTTLKLMHEQMVLASGGRVLRFSNIFGPMMSEETVIPRLSQQIGGNLPIQLHQNAIRDYLYVDDAVRAISLTLVKETPSIMNIGTGIGRDIINLVKDIAQVLEIKDYSIVSDSGKPIMNCNVLSVTGTINALGWHPSLDFKNQISRTLFVEK